MSKAQRLLAALLLALSPLNALADALERAPEPVWSAGAGFQFDKKADKKRESLSGIACPPVSNTPRLCIAAFDEGVEARYVTIEDHRLVPHPDSITLLPGGNELDAEGAARDGDTVYITGSHSPKRNDCSVNRDSRHVIRFKVDPANDRAVGTPETDRGRLWELLKDDPILGEFTGDGRCLGTGHVGKPGHAVNIEGLAAKSGVLYFGFRGPAKDRHTYVASVRADLLFAGAGMIEVTKLKVGDGRGIRDLLSVPEGILLLIGPDDDNEEDKRWSVGLWNGAYSRDPVTPKILADLRLKDVEPRPCKKPDPGEKAEIKPEAFTMLEDSSNFWRLLVLSDGMCNGGPMSFKIPK